MLTHVDFTRGGSYIEAMASRLIGLLVLVSLAPVLRAEPQSMSLAELIESVEGQGYRIIYNASLVPRVRKVTVEALSLDSLGRVLSTLGLELEEQGAAWVIVRAQPGDAPLEVERVERPPILESVIVTGSRHQLPYVAGTQSGFTLSPEAMSAVPTLGSDALRAALRLPGVSSVGVSAKPRIRGGLQDELLILQDGVELLEPFHLADYHSPYSGIDYRTIESLDVYTGGFPSRYGYRMSGVMEIDNRWRQEKYDTDIGVSTFASFVHTRGDFGDRESSDWLLSYRRGDLSDLTDYIDTRSGEPKYQDAAARMNVALSDNVQVSGGLVYAEDDIQFKDDEEKAASTIDNGYVWLGADWLLSASLATRINFSWLDFKRQREQENLEIDVEDPDKRGFMKHNQEIGRAALRNDWSALEGTDNWEFGWQLEYNDGVYRHRSQFDRGDLATILGSPGEVERNIRQGPDGWSGGGYLQLERDLSERLTVQPSLRVDYQDYYIDDGNNWQLSPRLGMAYDLTDAMRLRVSAGRFHQQEGVQELQVIDGVESFYAPQRLDQAVAGLQWAGTSAEMMAEIYYKRYDDLKGRFENILNPFVLLPELESDRVGLYPNKARVAGVDLDARYTFSVPLQTYFRYSYMDAQDRINGEWVDRRWSQEHTVNSGLVWQGDSYSISLAATWHSGWRSSELPPFVPEGTVLPVESVLNNTELDDYYSLDIGVRKFWEFPRARVEVYGDIINVTGRNNEAGIDYDIEELEGGFALTPDHEILLDRIVSAGITLSF